MRLKVSKTQARNFEAFSGTYVRCEPFHFSDHISFPYTFEPQKKCVVVAIFFFCYLLYLLNAMFSYHFLTILNVKWCFFFLSVVSHISFIHLQSFRKFWWQYPYNLFSHSSNSQTHTYSYAHAHKPFQSFINHISGYLSAYYSVASFFGTDDGHQFFFVCAKKMWWSAIKSKMLILVTIKTQIE